MARNEDFSNTFWSDPDVEELSANATLLYVWSWTNLRCGMAGMYRVSHRAMTESKVPLEQIPDALAELAAAGFVAYEDSVLWVRARVKRLRSRSPQVAKSVAKDLENIPADHPLRAKFVQMYRSQPWLRDALADTPSMTHREPIDDPSENPVGKGDVDGSSGTHRWVPLSGTGKGSLTGNGTPPTDKVQLPADFPDELLPHLRSVFRVLRDLAVRHHAKAVNPLSLASVVMGRPHKPLVRCAYDCAAHWDARGQQVKDVVAAYRNWLDKADDLAGYEQLGDSGLPVGASGRVVAVKGNASSMLRDVWSEELSEPVFVDAEVIAEDAA